MVKLNQGLTLGVLLVVIVVMILKPNLLGFLYNNVLGKVIFVAAIVFLSLKHTAAGLSEEKKKESTEGYEGKKKEGLKTCEGDDCDKNKQK